MKNVSRLCFAVTLMFLVIAVSRINKSKNDILMSQTAEEQTYYDVKTEEQLTNDVYDETYSRTNVYNETLVYASSFPDIELPEVEGYEKDAYGNYIITEEMFEYGKLPVNEYGTIDYVMCYDENGILVNPMPYIYNNYLQYFNSYGG